jgi:hypothetical protein
MDMQELRTRILNALKLKPMSETEMMNCLQCSRAFLRNDVRALVEDGEIHVSTKKSGVRQKCYELGPGMDMEESRDHGVVFQPTERGTMVVKFGDKYPIGKGLSAIPRSRGVSSLEWI